MKTALIAFGIGVILGKFHLIGQAVAYFKKR
jgi:hypothetical protein